MYSVYVVDDEPIILSGITHLLDWSKLECEIAGCFRNGKEAYDAIVRHPADIVITDIKMPVMDGLELVAKCASSHPQTVFVILTSLEEFRLVKEAIRYSVSEYIVKTELDEAVLTRVVAKAVREVERRRSIYSPQQTGAEGVQGVEQMVQNLFLMRDVSASVRVRLEDKGLMDSYGFVAFLLRYPSSTLETSWSIDDYMRLYEWQADIIAKVLPSVFPDSVRVTPQCARYGMFIYFIHDTRGDMWRSLVNRLGEKVRKASGMVTGLESDVVSSSIHTSASTLVEARDEVERAVTAHYLGRDDFELEDLDLDSVYPKIEKTIAQRNTVGFAACMRLLVTTLSTKDHGPGQASFILSALSSAVRAGLGAIGMLDEEMVDDLFAFTPFILSRSWAVHTLEDVRDEIESLLKGIGSASSSPIIDKAREYVLSHVTQRITLSDVASYAGVSLGYMSKSFKRVMGRSLVDYVNDMKVDRAREMMAASPHMRVGEVAIALGFENIYYFSKVFRRVTGMSPSEYQKQLQEVQ